MKEMKDLLCHKLQPPQVFFPRFIYYTIIKIKVNLIRFTFLNNHAH